MITEEYSLPGMEFAYIHIRYAKAMIHRIDGDFFKMELAEAKRLVGERRLWAAIGLMGALNEDVVRMVLDL